MVIYYLHLMGISFFPGEADPILVVDPDTVLPRPTPDGLLEAVARRDTQVRQLTREVDLGKLP